MIPLVNPFFAPFPLAALVAVAPRGAAAGRFAPYKAQGAAFRRPLALWFGWRGPEAPAAKRRRPPLKRSVFPPPLFLGDALLQEKPDVSWLYRLFYFATGGFMV